ncbi:MAG: nicotinate phosphoribosyltransferase [Butyribacter sp.]|nr:nicotinate phosphoribosyltransferase [bacterium]MDY3853463.1 nicotinate phosphoribosyltransferase [Butyribacter sp.]
MKSQHEARNLSMVMDFYELTMSNGYFDNADKDEQVVFDVFYRSNPDNGGYSIFAGLEQIVEYISNLHFSEEDIAYLRAQKIFREDFLQYLEAFQFQGDIYALPEGTVMYPYEPILTVVAPVIDAQLIETAILLEINHQSLIATKTRRICNAAKGRAVSDFGARRAHNMDAAVYGARAAYIGGANATATVLAGQMFDIPVSGTMAHSWVMYFPDEYTAFAKYAETYPDAVVLLVDTYDVLKSGVPNAIRVAKEVLEPQGKRLKGIRLDSGDLAYLSKKARKMLDDAGLEDCIIVASNSLDEFTIQSLISQGACIDSFGVGERLITSKSEPVFGAVYKLAAVKRNGVFEPRIKISENVEKITNPGFKKLYRVYDENNKAVADLIACEEEKIVSGQRVEYINPQKPWKKHYFENCHFKELQQPVFQEGKYVGQAVPATQIRDYVRKQLEEEIWEEEQRFENPHAHYLDMTPAYYEMKNKLLEAAKE